jgi:signal transduction histidine kinase
MLEDVERLDALINHLLEAARLEHRVEDSDVEDIDVAKSLRHCVEVVCARYRLPNEVVHLDLERCIVQARTVDFELVFRNLIDNALKYASDEPLVEVSAQRSHTDQCTIRISDNGNGIPPDLRRKIFGRFFRRGEELERETKGLGLGLYIVRTLVRRLHGRIRVKDREGGSGTTFEVTLPTRPREQAAEISAGSEPPTSETGAA